MLTAIPVRQNNGRSAPSMPVEVWGATDKGRQRAGNEDAVYPHSGADTFPFQPTPQQLARKGHLLVVADGVGGAGAGSEASHYAIRVAVERYYDLPGPDLGADLRASVEVANGSLYHLLQATGRREAGSTMVAAVIHGDMLYLANVGDSRAYLIRDGQITQLTHDHTLAQQKIEQGLRVADSDHSVLTRSLGAGPTVRVDLFPPLRLVPGDVVLLCSDGLTDMLTDEEIARLVGTGSLRRAAQRLIAAANRQGGLDNISVVIARVGGRKAAAKGGLLDDVRGMSRQQKTFLLVGAVLVAVTLCLLGALVLAITHRGQGLPTATPTATEVVAPVVTTAAPEMTAPRPTDTVAAGAPTSTPRPTFTPTPTPSPPTPTFTPTSTPTPTPTSPPASPQPPPPSSPEPTEKPTLPPPTSSPTPPG